MNSSLMSIYPNIQYGGIAAALLAHYFWWKEVEN